MKISKTTLFAIIFISIVISSCEPYIHKFFLTEDELDWLRVYNKNDTIIFIEDVNSNLDTLIIKDCLIKNPKNHNPFDWEDKSLIAMILETSNEICGWGHIEYDLIHNHKIYRGAIRLVKQNNKSYADYSISIRNGIRWYNQITTAKQGLFYITVPDRLYLNSDSNKVVSNLVWDDIKELTWDKHTGLESYSFGDSIYYRFYKRIPAKQDNSEQ